MSGGGGGGVEVRPPSIDDFDGFTKDPFNVNKNPFLNPGANPTVVPPGMDFAGNFFSNEYELNQPRPVKNLTPGYKPGDTAASFKKKIMADENIDQAARDSLLDGFGSENPDIKAINEKYKQILDPEHQLGKEMLSRKTAKKTAADTPGLSKQTSFYDAPSSGGFLGGR